MSLATISAPAVPKVAADGSCNLLTGVASLYDRSQYSTCVSEAKASHKAVSCSNETCCCRDWLLPSLSTRAGSLQIRYEQLELCTGTDSHEADEYMLVGILDG